MDEKTPSKMEKSHWLFVIHPFAYAFIFHFALSDMLNFKKL